MLENIECAANSQDNIIVWDETLEELQNRAIEVFQSIIKQDLKLNKKKARSINLTFLGGHKITEQLIFPSKKKLKQLPTCNILQM